MIVLRLLGCKKIEYVPGEVKPRAERMHMDEKESGSYEDLLIGKKTYIDVHNRKSVNEY
jgi:hypothetical protein